MGESNWVVELLNGLEEDKLKELLRTCALITDPLSQELMKKAEERVCGDCSLYRSFEDNPEYKNLDNPYDWDGCCLRLKNPFEVDADSPECRWAKILRGGK